MRVTIKKNAVRFLGLILFTTLFGCAQQPIQQSSPQVAAPPPVEEHVSSDNSDTATPVRKQSIAAVHEASTPADICKEPYDIWVRIRNGYVLPDKDKPGVEPDQLWFARHQEYLSRVSERATPYIHNIVDSLEKRHMPSELALLPVVESAYQPFAYSNGRASGLWQFIPGTGSRFGLRQNWWYDGRRDVDMATQAALDYLEELHQMFDGDWLLA